MLDRLSFLETLDGRHWHDMRVFQLIMNEKFNTGYHGLAGSYAQTILIASN